MGTRLQVLLETPCSQAHGQSQQGGAGQQDQQRMHRDRQGQVRDPGQHGQRHQAGFRAVVDEAGFAARAEPANVTPHQAVDQTNKRCCEDQRQRC